jgi:hypothetical protein
VGFSAALWFRRASAVCEENFVLALALDQISPEASPSDQITLSFPALNPSKPTESPKPT